MYVTIGEGYINGSAAVWVRFAFICPITLDLWKLKCTILYYCGNTSTTIIVAATIMHYTRIISMNSIIMKFPPYATNLYTLYQLLTPTTPCGSKRAVLQ